MGDVEGAVRVICVFIEACVPQAHEKVKGWCAGHTGCRL